MPIASIDEIRLEGCVAIVTGAARGLGKTMAMALVGAGADVVFADIDGQAATAAVADCEKNAQSGTALAVQCDITDKDDCRTCVETAVTRFGALHILVNNAALGPTHIERAPLTRSAKFYQADPDAWQDVIATNVNGTYLMSYHAAPAILAAGWGRIVNITTSLPTMQRGSNSPYGVSKTAIEAETLIWAQDLAGSGVTVNSLIPGGAADTDFVSAPTRASIAKSGRKLIDPKVMVAPLLWLMSEEADTVTARRYVGKLWDHSMKPAAAAAGALEPPVLRVPETGAR